MIAITMLLHHRHDQQNSIYAVNQGKCNDISAHTKSILIQFQFFAFFLFSSHSRNYPNDGMDNIAAVIDPTYPNSTPSSVATPLGGPTGILPAHLDYTSTEHNNSMPVPPYMPIQGTRRINGISQPEKKKKSKDKCTHQ